MKAKEYLEAILMENQEEELYTLFYEQMCDDDVDPFESVTLFNLIYDKLNGHW